MADFRKMLYAFALVALLTALTVPAAAQGMNCTSPTGAPAAIRQGGFTEMVGYMDIECESQIANTSTPANQGVKQGTLRIKVTGTTFTSKVVSTSGATFVESLLLVDKPTPTSRLGDAPPYYGQLPCGTASNDSSPGLPGVCNIISTGDPDQTYDGNPVQSGAGGCSAGFGCGRPNIFQGRQSTDTATCPVATCVEFKAVPLDPPGTNKKRVFRFTNFRVNAAALAVGSIVLLSVSVVDSQTAFNLPLEKRAEVAEVVASAPSTSFNTNSEFVLCESEDESPAGAVVISEGTGGSGIWRARNTVVQRVNSSDYIGNNFTNYSGGTTISASDDPQNNPDGGYFTESGFTFGCGSSDGCSTISGATTLGNGLWAAGVASTGTLLAFPVTSSPAGVSVSWPSTVPLVSGSTTTGFLRLVSHSFSNIVIYEVGHTQPFLNETATIIPDITYTAIIVGPVSYSAGSAILAPYGSSVNGVFTPGTTSEQWPRFAGSLGAANQTLFEIGSCTCNLLFPWVVSNNQYVTGFAVSNTSKDPTNAGLSPLTAYTAVQQAGKVSLYLFGTNSAGTSTVAAQAASSPSPSIASGTSATFIVGGVSGGFQGYAIAQAEFQYCHGVAFLFSSTTSIPPMSYLGLVMDKADKRRGGYGGGYGPEHSSSGNGELPRTVNKQSDRMDN